MNPERLSPLQRREHNNSLHRLPEKLEEVPEAEWRNAEHQGTGYGRIGVWRSRRYLVQIFQDPNKPIRISVNRARIDLRTGKWEDRIKWDELQAIKRHVGYGEYMAVEIYPEDEHIVDVANMRHLWVLKQRYPWAWTKVNR